MLLVLQTAYLPKFKGFLLFPIIQFFPADCLHANIFTFAGSLHSKPLKAQVFQHIANFSMAIARQSPPVFVIWSERESD
jgi:hypothetical protein